MISVALIHVVN